MYDVIMHQNFQMYSIYIQFKINQTNSLLYFFHKKIHEKGPAGQVKMNCRIDREAGFQERKFAEP